MKLSIATSMYAKALLLLAACITLISCSSNQKSISEDRAQMPPILETVSQGAHGGFSSNGDKEFVIRDSENFSQFWKNMHGPQLGQNENIPDINFQDFMIIAVFMGEMPSSGYSIGITEIESGENSLTVKVQETRPGSTCMNMTVMTAPHHIVKIPSSDKDVSFVYNTQINECD
ncbi:MAG: protease complex subunit PrcB family protein [Balneolales bacterium]|nr:protease complex subunit PrcB family protein [Balneolales bacterium]